MAKMSRLRKELCELYLDGRLRDSDGVEITGAKGNVPVHISFALTGDKPFMCHVLGRQNMNADAFSFQCDCLAAPANHQVML